MGCLAVLAYGVVVVNRLTALSQYFLVMVLFRAPNNA